MKLTNASFLGRMLRRTGRFGIALLSLAAFFIAAGALYIIPAMTIGYWFPRVTLVGGLAAAAGVYKLLDHLNLIPEDPDAIITLSLTERREDVERRGYVSGDNVEK